MVMATLMVWTLKLFFASKIEILQMQKIMKHQIIFSVMNSIVLHILRVGRTVGKKVSQINYFLSFFHL